MTMYVRTLVPMTLTISSQNDEDDVLLDGNHLYSVLPLWAAQKPEFQQLWADNQVQVATDPDFNDVVTEIPASEIPGGAPDLSGYAALDEGGRIPGGLIPNMLYLEETHDSTGHTVLRLASPGNTPNHFSFSSANSNQAPVISAASDTDESVNLQLTGGGPNGKVVLGDLSRVLSTTIPLNPQTGDYTLTADDAGALVSIDSTTPHTVIVPNSTNVYYPIGTFIDVARFGTGAVSVNYQAGVTVFAVPGRNIANRFQMARLIKIGEDSWLLTGSLSA